MQQTDPSDLQVGTILAHHLQGVPGGTGSMIPRRTSRSSPALTSFSQCTGTWIGVWTACGSADSLNVTLTGGLSICWSGWYVHVLNALEANWANIHSLSFGTFSLEGVMGIFSGRAGVGVFSGQVHLASMSPHLDACEGDSLAVVGKGRLMTPKS